MREPHYTTKEVARKLGLAVRSVQLMVDRGELDAWKTPGGHRRITQGSVDNWLARHRAVHDTAQAASPRQINREAPPPSHIAPLPASARVLIIEDSVHFQKIISLLISHRFPTIECRVADDGIAGLAMAGQWQPDVLIVDILLPGIDGATLITSLRTHPQFERMQLIVVTSLDESRRAPYALAMEGVPIVHKLSLIKELPPILHQCLYEQVHLRQHRAPQ
jgi:excisionase family DNA binding protein